MRKIEHHIASNMDSKTTSFKIVMFPWLAHGHIFPFLELAKRILKTQNFHIYFCSTSINFTSINKFIQNNLLQNSIEVVQLHLPPSHELPPTYHTTKNLPSNLVSNLIIDFQKSKSSFSEIITYLKPDLVIYDIFQPWAAKVASLQDIPSVHFACVGASTLSYVHHRYVSGPEACDYPFKDICLKNHEMNVWDDVIEFVYANVFEEDKDVFFVNFKLSYDIVLVKTSLWFEGKYMDYLSSFFGKKLVPIGPLVSYDHNRHDEDNEDDDEIMQWLSKRYKRSTVYISFGSEHFLSNDEIGEIAKGLELCDVNFIWIIRFPNEAKRISAVEETLPKGFLERVKGRGIVVHGWAPQAKILSHESVGGFVSHCGWSSVTESVYHGVPIIAMPMKVDQPINARMLVETDACLEVLADENGAYEGDEIARAIKSVMMEKSGDRLRLRARELSEKMKMEEEEEFGRAAELLWQICLKNNKRCKN